MERYDYLEAIKEDVLNYINENNIPVNYSENGISKAFDISVSPMELVYGISGSR